jgi:thiol-disulfide isomerase/thioredoxin
MTQRLLLFWFVVLLLVPIVNAQNEDEGDNRPVSDFEGNPELAMPPFPEEVEWVNVSQPLTLDDLRGKIVILDFWTYGCINCIHMIPIFEALQAKYPDELAVIGVHSAKFTNEGETENIQQVVQRYNVQHPVINDKDFLVWRTYGIRAWPTFVVIDPRGNILAAQSGEIPFEAFDPLIAGMIEYWDGLGEINREPIIQRAVEGAALPNTALNFPGKVLVDGAGGRLFIADTNNHRIVIADLETHTVLDIIGNGTPGLTDGSFDTAQLRQPYGMALRDNVLYIADTKNHAIRIADLNTRTIDIAAGTGEMGRGGPLTFGMQIREPRAYALRSPWDVTFGDENTLFIAHAGSHQIFEMNVETGVMRPSVGNGREAMKNATLDISELAQPSGLYFHDGLLYFADSESSTIRVADYTNNTVMTVSGTVNDDLFDYGDIDGPVGTSRLQHVLGITGDGNGTLYIADTYNSRIKTIDANMNTETLFGLGGNGGFANGDATTAQFDEPGGLDYHDGRLYVADTNNHAIRIIDLETGTVETIHFPNPERLQIAEQLTVIGGNQPLEEIVTLEPLTLTPDDTTLQLVLNLPMGYKLNLDAPSTLNVHENDALNISAQEVAITETSVTLPLTLNAAEGVLQAEITVFYCEAVNTTLCFIDEFTVEARITVDAASEESAIEIKRDIVPPQLD